MGQPRTKSSDSDNGTYPATCGEAARSDEVFAVFKQAPAYQEILEHVTANQGAEYFACLAPELAQQVQRFQRNDHLGSPVRYEYPFGTFSPTTLRYVKVLGDLIAFDLQGDIIEIGAGYGGQCCVMKQLFRPRSYSIVDLPEALALSKRYLTDLGLVADMQFIDGHDRTYSYRAKYDLVISNYAISECTEDVQDFYIENILKRSTHGYITHNQFCGFGLEDFVRRIGQEVKVSPEVPLTGHRNVVLTW